MKVTAVLSCFLIFVSSVSAQFNNNYNNVPYLYSRSPYSNYGNQQQQPSLNIPGLPNTKIEIDSFKAVAIIRSPTGSNSITGNVTLFRTRDLQDVNPVTIFVNLRNVPPGEHGFHVHEFGDLSNGCASTGGHFNPFNVNHGGIQDQSRHVGDLGNVVADQNGNVNAVLKSGYIRINGPLNIIGRAFVLHEKPDDFGKAGNQNSTTTGNAGNRLACGIIGMAQSEKP